MWARVAPMRAKLFGMSISHPAHAARLMLEHKGIDYDLVSVSPGNQAWRVRLAGFRSGTVPALVIGDRRAQGTTSISRFLDELVPSPPLFPADPQQRRAVEEAEAWGEREFQPIPRRALRWALRRRPEARAQFAKLTNQPAPRVAELMMVPFAAYYARREDASSTERVRQDWRELPGHLDRIDALIADGVLGGERLNAADFQIGTTTRVMLALEDFAPLIEGRPCEAHARRVMADYRWRVPSLLPAEVRGEQTGAAA